MMRLRAQTLRKQSHLSVAEASRNGNAKNDDGYARNGAGLRFDGNHDPGFAVCFLLRWEKTSVASARLMLSECAPTNVRSFYESGSEDLISRGIVKSRGYRD